MKKQNYYLFLILILVVILLLIFFPNKNTLKFNPDNAQNLGISETVKDLEECKGYTQVAEEEKANYQFCAFDIEDNDLIKLKLIENLNGVELCAFDDKEGKKCDINNYFNENSKLIWKFEWQTITVKTNYNYLMIWKSGENYFYTNAGNFAAGTPYSGSIFLIDTLESDLIKNLK